MTLSKRLETILSFIAPCEILLDVGADHGLISIEAMNRGLAKKVLAIENKLGPFLRLKEAIEKNQKNDAIEAILSDGLKSNDQRIKTCLIAGMGTKNAISILKAAKNIASIETLIIDSHTNLEELRRFVTSIGFKIEDEKIVYEDKIFYEIIVFKKGNAHYSDLDFIYGPLEMKRKDPLFKAKLEERRKEIETILAKPHLSLARIKSLNDELERMRQL